MKKIPSLFLRDPETKKITEEYNPLCQWVVNREGQATQKLDGTACMIRDGKLFKRYDSKNGKTPPSDFEPCQDPDPNTGHWPGWIPVKDGPEDKYFNEAYNSKWVPEDKRKEFFEDGTYELCGPKINGNPEGLEEHLLIKHGKSIPLVLDLGMVPISYQGLKDYLSTCCMEGLVWHHPDGRMAKIKKRDFGFKR